MLAAGILEAQVDKGVQVLRLEQEVTHEIVVALGLHNVGEELVHGIEIMLMTQHFFEDIGGDMPDILARGDNEWNHFPDGR